MKYLLTIENFKTDQQIIDDILSCNESMSDVLQKVRDYGKKGLLTTAILLSLVGSIKGSDAQKDIIEQGTEFLHNKDRVDFYNAVIALSTQYESKSMQDGEIEAAGAFKKISIYYSDLRDGKPSELDHDSKKYLGAVLNSIKQYSNVERQNLIKHGATIHRT